MISDEIPDLFPTAPFVQRYECIGRLTTDDKSVEHLHLIIEAPTNKQGDIVGWVLGNLQTYTRLALWTKEAGVEYRFESASEPLSRFQISSSKVRLGEVSDRHIATDPSGISTYAVARLHFDELEVTYKREQSEQSSRPRDLEFFIDGPSLIWHVFRFPKISLEHGEEEGFDILNKDIELDDDLPFKVEIFPFELRSRAPSPDGFSLSTTVMRLRLHSKLAQNEISDDAFFEEGQKTVNDLLLLASLATRAWIVWHGYAYETPNSLKHVFRGIQTTPSEKVEYHHTLVEPTKSREFFKTSFRQLRVLRAQRFDVSMPLSIYISGCAAKYAQQQFADFFLALEHLKDAYIRSNSTLLQILKDPEFRRLRSSFEKAIEQDVADPELRSLILEKLPELNRPSIRRILERMQQDFGTEWRDLYPSGGDFTLIKSRNILFIHHQVLNHLN